MEVFNLNIIPGAVAPIIHASQYDEDREFRANLFEGDQVFELTGEETISVNVRKTDGNVVTAAVVNTGANYVDFSTTLQMTACAGANLCQLRIENSPRKIGTLNFILAVERDPLEGGIQSESEINNLETQVAEMVAEEVAEQYDSGNVIFDNEPTDNHGIGYTVTSEGIKTAIDNAFDYDKTASGSIIHITDGADNIPVKSLVSEIVAVESGSGEKSPTNPYTISGFSSATIRRDNKNLISLISDTVQANRQTSITINSISDNSINMTSGGLAYACFGRFIFLKVGKYTVSLKATASDSYNPTATMYKGSTTIVSGINNTTPKTFTVSADGIYELRMFVTGSGDTTIRTVTFSEIQIETGEDKTTYEAYNGTTYTFAFGQTVYGGHFDNKGNLVVTHGTVDLGDLSWTSQSTSTQYSYYSEVLNNAKKPSSSSVVADILASIYETKNTLTFVTKGDAIIGLSTSGRLNVNDNRFTTASDFKTGVTGIKVVYELANPLVLPITSQDIPTLLGENNIFSNCGDVEVTYYTNKSNDILDFIDSEIGKKNGTNIPIDENSPDSIKDYIDDEISSTKDYVDNGLNGKVDTSYLNDMLVVERKFQDVTFDTYYKSLEIDVSKSGYTPIGTVGFQTNIVGALFFRCNLTGNTLYIGLVARDGTSPITGTIATYVDVLYLKNS